MLRFFESDRPEDTAELELSGDGFRATLRRGRADEDRIRHMPFDVADYEPGNDTDDLHRYLPGVVTSKTCKMAKAGVPQPWILAVIDANGWARDAWVDILPEEAEQFGAIYRIENERAVLVVARDGFPGTNEPSLMDR